MDEAERKEKEKPFKVDDSSTLLTDASVSIEDLSGLEQMLDTILGRLDETDLKAKLALSSDYIIDDLGVVEKDMMAAGISFRLIVQDIPAVPDELKYMRTAEVTVGPVGGEVEIPGFAKLSAARGILQEDTMVTISTVDIPSILRGPEGVNWISGYPWSPGEDTCPQTLPTKTAQPETEPGDITPDSNVNGSGGNKPVVLLINDGYSVSAINRQMAGFLVSEGAVVYSLVLGATKEDEEDAAADGVRLILPTTFEGDERAPTLAWLTWDHMSRYPELPSDINFVVGHVNITSHAARQIKENRLPGSKLVQVTHVIPEDTSKYKGDAKVLRIERESAVILEDLLHADVIFSIGPHIYDYYKSQTRELKPHHEFLPRPSDIFNKLQVKHVDTETKVVLSIGRVKGVEREKGYDLAAKTMNIVIEQLPNTKWRARGVSAEDFPESKAVIQANVKNDKFNFTPLKYATQKELSEDMQKADVVLMPSRAEPFGLVGLEAIAAGIPVLVSHKSGLAWFLKSQDPGFDRLIVEIPDDDDEAVKTLAKRVIAVLKNGSREFEASRRLKEKLLASEYWNESHRVFLKAFGL
ncbi:PREDICTED: uncharacterized protein LOC109483326 [Branchiostoma belcheri]|uniref:Uncharacterized protein LOC109483326 n=1 Tax=Branchiostoma belcheri TaxID=7741 RepID=A0A6P4ZY93_BRABE|nr:PREDICTED: uncharacterized protein LOC109483326 [Branchiostoma belcheri]